MSHVRTFCQDNDRSFVVRHNPVFDRADGSAAQHGALIRLGW